MQASNLFTLRYGLNRLVHFSKRSPLLKCSNYSSSKHVQNKLPLATCCFSQNLFVSKPHSISCNFQTQWKGFRTRRALGQQKEAEAPEPEPEKLSLVKRYKKMLKEYWYVLIPVHMVTSSLWFGGFYYIAKSGFDIVPYLEMVNLPESIIKPLRNPLLGNIAVASALYKIATPARYMVTLGGTTMAIKFLTKRGLIKPVPSREKFKTMIKSKLQSAKDSRT